MNIILVWEHMVEEDRRETRRLVACAAAIIAIMVLCLLFVFVPVADAKLQSANDAPSNSLPFITDVNPVKPDEYLVVIECAGHVDAVKVNKKKAKRVRRNMWTFKAKAGKLYKISAGQKTISYRIER